MKLSANLGLIAFFYAYVVCYFIIMKNSFYTLFVLLALAGFVSACSEPEKQASASKNVHVLPYQFAMPGLDRQRTVRLYLPPSYEKSHEKNYPVIYMHDGQNLFDQLTAYAGEWQIDEALDKLAIEQGLEFIVVGIDNGGEARMNELSPWPNERFGVAQGQEYMDFIVEVVKPYIDTNFRTESDRLNTAIMGSSMGGLISHYAVHQYPDVFSKAGIFSPSYWYSQDVYAFTKFKKAKLDARLYVMFGDNEGNGMIADSDTMQRQLKQQGHPRQNMLFKRVAGGKHNEALWGSEFVEAVKWLFQQQPTF
ncbi:alpha/beta hydrolase-fold protein [Paraglaciecola aquimarina]|uniref:Alpha/beta hydrolase-fold protein n=1 Tax=Paraglaciecola aquimarina TaxID=1235557 RepID=A0ABU3SXD4_9ALTE|nr:alpha/beta hydrolase-fold protein [Paraglaciecola aquimarina]MDU0354582.1 alpha/beta hydrolase-fold protein [Paraglaciecola aquimarina]